MNSIKAGLALRIAIGAAAYIAPATTGRAFGIDPERNPASPYLGRLFGARDVALGVGGLAVPAEARRGYIALLAGIDAADLASALIGRRAGYLSSGSTLLLSAAAIAALVPELIELANGDKAEATEARG